MQVDFASEAELLAHYKAVRERLRGHGIVREKPKAAPIFVPVPLHVSRVATSQSEIYWEILGTSWPTPWEHSRRAGSHPVHRIQEVIAARYGFSRNALLGPSRNIHLVRARHIAMYVTRTETKASYPELGRRFGKDHSTIISAVRKMTELIAACPKFAAEMAGVHEFLEAVA